MYQVKFSNNQNKTFTCKGAVTAFVLEHNVTIINIKSIPIDK